jgi:hypothetical protein
MLDDNGHENTLPENLAYIKGKVYFSESDACITDEDGDKFHVWKPNNDEVDRFFTPYHEEKAYATFDEEPMVKDVPVPFDIAKDLKIICHLSINNCECMGTYDTHGYLNGDYTTEQFPCPTIYNACAFIRAISGIDIVAFPIDSCGSYMGGEKYRFNIYRGGKNMPLDTDIITSPTYEKAIENGLRYTIKKYIKK